jgi:hypothetical protein
MRLTRKLSFFIPLVWLWGCDPGWIVPCIGISSILADHDELSELPEIQGGRVA